MSPTLKFSLRDYQIDIIRKIYAAWGKHRRILAQLPTGGGKTVVFGAITQEFIQRKQRVLILAHREELILQAANKVGAIAEAEVGIIKAGYKPKPEALIQVASVQSLVNRIDQVKDLALIIIDESHHATASTYKKILSAFPKAYHLGVTATPVRLDGGGFDSIFELMVSGITVNKLIKQGYLSKFKLFADPQPMNTKGAKNFNGDYNINDLARANNIVELAGNLISSYKHYAMGKSCVVFAINVIHSKEIAHRYNKAGIKACHLDGSTSAEERRESLKKFEAGEIKVISNCALFDEGLDIPALEIVQIARPTQSLSKWLQMVGRGLRTAPSKKFAVILDHTNNWAIHGLPTRPRKWSLSGVESKKMSLEMSEDGLVVDKEYEFEAAEIHENEMELSEIDVSIEAEWDRILEDLILELEVHKHKKGWLFSQLQDFQPPLKVWQKCGKYLGYTESWAAECFNSQQMDMEFS